MTLGPDSPGIDVAAIKADAEWLAAAGPEATEEDHREHWDRLYQALTPELILLCISEIERAATLLALAEGVTA